MKNLKNKINFLFCFSVIFFIIVSFLHFLVVNKKEKEAQAAAVLSIAGVTGISMDCAFAPPNCAGLCSGGLKLVQVTQRFSGDVLPTAVLCIPQTGLPLLSGRPLSMPGTTFLGGFTAVAPVAIQAGYTGSY
jgi:hypothetical protein